MTISTSFHRLLGAALLAAVSFSTAACSPTTETTGDAAPTVPEAYAAAFSPMTGDEPALEDFFISVHDVAGAMDEGMEVVFLDARPELDFEFGHIDGAISVPYFDVGTRLNDVPRDKWVVTYCECPHHEAGQAAQELYANGYPYVKVLEEGLGGWRDELGRELVMPETEG